MKLPASILDAAPAATTPDTGPRHRAGPLTLFLALTCTMTAAGAGLLLAREGQTPLELGTLVLFAALAVLFAARVVERARHREPLPRARAVLPDVLGFRLRCTCRDVGPAVFLLPDSVPAGGRTRLFVFLENYASRRRVARVRIGPHPLLGLPAPVELGLALAPAQAAVLVFPLAVSALLPPGEHDLPVTLCVAEPTGSGLRLPGAPRHLYDLHTVHYAAPLTVSSASAASGGAPSPAGLTPARFITLAGAGQEEPDFAELERVVAEA